MLLSQEVCLKISQFSSDYLLDLMPIFLEFNSVFYSCVVIDFNLNDLILSNKIPFGCNFAYQLSYSDLSKSIESIYALNQPCSSILNIVDVLSDHHEYVEVITKNLQIL